MLENRIFVRYITLLASFICLFSVASKADDDVYFHHLTPRDGLSQINIMSIYQDELGAMWFGTTEGLNRYNNKEIESFRPSNRQDGLSSNIIYTICGNKAGAIYLKAGKDLVRYDIYTQQFENLHNGGRVQAITYNNGNLWAVIDKEIMQYDEQSKQLRLYATINKNVSEVISIFNDKNNNIWLGTASGLVVISKDNVQKQEYIIKGAQIYNIYQSRNNHLWIASSNDGVYEIDLSNNITNHKHHKTLNSLSNDQVRDIEEDDAGNIWVATFYGLNQYNPQTKQWKQYISNDNVPHSISHSSVFALYKDEQGTMWAGTYFGGVNYFRTQIGFRYYGASSSNDNYLSFPYVSKMTEDKHGNLWICTEGGALNCLNLETRQFSRHMFNRYNLEDVIYYNQKSIWYRADKDLLYIGIHNGGLTIFDINTKKTRVLVNDKNNLYSLPNNTINEMQYYDGMLIILTQRGLYKIDLDTEKCYSFSDNPLINAGLSEMWVYTFYIDTKDRLWLVKNEGLTSVNLKTNEIKKYQHDETNERSIGRLEIVDIFESSSGDLYFASLGSGISKFKEDTDDFDNYTSENNILTDNYCYNISETPSGHLMFLHNKSFTFFDPQSPDKKLFRSSSNFPISGFNIGNSAYTTKKNEIFIGGINGLVSFYENDLAVTDKGYNLYFDRLMINNKVVHPGDEFRVLNTTLALCQDIKLKYNQNNFTIEFATSDYLQTMTRNFEYKLDGFDTEWKPTKTKLISYTNLDAGEYTLLVREAIANEDNKNIYSLGIVISPPFYLSPWAFVIYTTLIILAIYGFLRFYLWRTKMETKLAFERKDKERIEEINQIKLRFFTNVSHELRTPLTLIIGQVESLLIQGDLGANAYNKIVRIHNNTKHLLNLISELLDFRKQEQGFYKLNVSKVELVSYIKDIYVSFIDYATKKQIEYKIECGEEEIYIYIDPSNFQKAIYNLLSNAFKYTPSGGEIKIKIEPNDTDVLIKVIDNGIGIPSKSLNKIFERFYQLEYRSSELTLGTGIGLALTKEIISSHKGHINVDSILNVGSIFTINLKKGKTHFTEEELSIEETQGELIIKPIIFDSESLTERVEEDEDNDDEKPTVLIVDDNESLLEMLTETFSNYYTIHTAINGKEAMNLVLTIQPELIISDIMMPEMSGKELCYRIKNTINTSHIPVVLLTAQITDSQIIDGYMFGADAYITKPFNMQILLSHCSNIIKNRRLLYKKYANSLDESFSSFVGESDSDKALIEKAIAIIRENFNNPDFDMNKLGAELGMGRSKLYIKIKDVTGFTPNELTLNIKLKHAAHLLDNKSHMNISDIAYELGFSSTKYFSKCFKMFYGIVPQDWRRRNKAK